MNPSTEESVILEDNISQLDLAEEDIIITSEDHPIPITSTRSGKVVKPKTIKQKTLAKRYPRKTDKEQHKIRASLRREGLLV